MSAAEHWGIGPGWSKPLQPREFAGPLMSLPDAARLRIERVRYPEWQEPMDHVRIHVQDGKMGPWVDLYSPWNLKLRGVDPMRVLAVPPNFCLRQACFVPYDGPLPEAIEYKARADEIEAA